MTDGEVVLPAGYPELLHDLKNTVAAAGWRTQRVVNTELLALYWHIGRTILEQQQAEGWGTRVIGRLSADLQAAFPQMRGPSRSNLLYMRSFAAHLPRTDRATACCAIAVGARHRAARQARRPGRRAWYAAAAAEHGWSRNVLLNQIMDRLHERAGAAPSNFTAKLPAADSEIAQQLTRDPYVLDFLDLTGPVAERDLKAALTQRLQAFLLELGPGGSRSSAASTTSPSTATTSTSICCSSTGPNPGSSSSS